MSKKYKHIGIESERLLKLTQKDVAGMNEAEYRETLTTLVRTIEKDNSKACEGITGGVVKKLRSKLEYFKEHRHETDISGGIKDVRRQDWEINHIRIKAFIRNYLIEKRGMPSVTTISNELNISRVTVYEHLNEGISGEFYAEKMKEIEYMTLDILQLLYLKLIEGNVMAGKIWLDYVSKIQQGTSNIRQQNNYLQVNNLVLDHSTMEQLPEDDRRRIGDIQQELQRIISKQHRHANNL